MRLYSSEFTVIDLGKDKKLKKQTIFKTVTKAYRAQKEADALNQLEHFNIRKCYGFEKPNTLILEYIDGQTLRRAFQQRILSLVSLQSIVSDLGRALAYVHSKNLVHCDIQPDNVILRSVPFQSAVLIDCELCSEHGSLVPFCGSYEYMPPEMFVNTEFHMCHPAMDMWAMGMMLYEALTGKVVTDEAPTYARTEELMVEVFNGKKPCPLHWPPKIDENLKDLISKLLHPQSQQRLSAAQVLQHPFVLNPRRLSPVPIRSWDQKDC